MALEPEVLTRRLVAARELRGKTQTDLHKSMEAEGFGKHDVARIERGDPDMHLTASRRRALSQILDVPEWWFTAEDDELFMSPEQDGFALLERRFIELERRVAQLAERWSLDSAREFVREVTAQLGAAPVNGERTPSAPARDDPHSQAGGGKPPPR